MRASDRSIKVFGFLVAIVVVGSAIAIAFFVALRTFWWCPEGGCALHGWADRLHLLGNVGGVIGLMLAACFVLQFVFLLFARPFVGRELVDATFFRSRVKGFGWHDALLRRWVRWLWG